jgi:hypothetical protein
MMAGRYAHAKHFNRHRKVADPALTARPHHPRYRPQNRRQCGVAGGLRLAAFPRQPDPFAASSASAAGSCIRSMPRRSNALQGQGQRALRVRRQGVNRHHQRPRSGRPVRAQRQGRSLCGLYSGNSGPQETTGQAAYVRKKLAKVGRATNPLCEAPNRLLKNSEWM